MIRKIGSLVALFASFLLPLLRSTPSEGQCSSAQYAAGVMADSPTAYYRLNELSPTDGVGAIDETGNFNGTYRTNAGAAPVSVVGASPLTTDTAVLFDKITDTMAAPLQRTPLNGGQIYVFDIDYFPISSRGAQISQQSKLSFRARARNLQHAVDAPTASEDSSPRKCDGSE